MPRTWSYRKRDYQLAKPEVKGISPQIVGLFVLYTLICSAVIIGMTYALTHKLRDSDTTPISRNISTPGQPLDGG